MKRLKSIFLLIVFVVLVLTSCSSKPGVDTKNIKNEGNMVATDPQIITTEYVRNSDEAFFASLDFELKAGSADWEIQSPKGKSIFRGLVSYENGKTLRQLVYPPDFLKGTMSNKEEVKNEPDFNYLQFDAPITKGAYKLIITPKGASGKYSIEWHSKLPRK
jgi:hypothetical protein